MPRFFRRIGFALLFTFFLPGCRSGGDKKYDLIESELRSRERELADAQAELNSVRAIQQMRPVAQANDHGPVRGPLCRDITLGTGTGGYDADGKPGDEGLQIILVPKDDDGSAIKVPGQLTIAAFDISRDGMKTSVGLWDIPPEKLRIYWQTGLLSTGYKLALQWHSPPISGKIRIIARLTTMDGRPFETEKDVTVKPMTMNDSRASELPPPSGFHSPNMEYDPFPQGARLKPARIN